MAERMLLDPSTLPSRKEVADSSPSARRRATVIFLLFLLMVLSVLQSGCGLFSETDPKGKSGAAPVTTQNLHVGDDVRGVLNAGAGRTFSI